jgi:death-on-curing protein
LIDKAAVLIVRLAKNHPLPDGNKRAAWVALRLFIEINGWGWSARPSVDEAERAVLVIAAGESDEARTAAWLHEHIAPAAS